jgi:hypothetical protein
VVVKPAAFVEELRMQCRHLSQRSRRNANAVRYVRDARVPASPNSCQPCELSPCSPRMGQAGLKRLDLERNTLLVLRGHARRRELVHNPRFRRFKLAVVEIARHDPLKRVAQHLREGLRIHKSEVSHAARWKSQCVSRWYAAAMSTAVSAFLSTYDSDFLAEGKAPFCVGAHGRVNDCGDDRSPPRVAYMQQAENTASCCTRQ